MTNFVSWINDVPGQSGAIFAAAAAWKQVGQQIASAADDIYAVDDALSSWVGFARASFHRSSQRTYHRYLNLGEGIIDGASVLEKQGWTVDSGQRYIEQLRYHAEKLDQEFAKTPAALRPLVYQELCVQAAALAFAAYAKIIEVKQATEQHGQELAQTFHNEPITVDQSGNPTETGQRAHFTDTQIDQINADLNDLLNGSFDFSGMKQGNIGDCYYLSSLMGLAQSPEGQELLASLIEPHYDASKTRIDGYYVTIFNDPADPTRSGTQRILVHDYYLNGVTQNGQVTVYSLMEAAYGQAHGGGANDSGQPHYGMSGGWSEKALHTLTQHTGYTLRSDEGSPDYTPSERARIQAASSQHLPIIAESATSLEQYDNQRMATVTVTTSNGTTADIRLYQSHAYTVTASDENGITLCNPHGTNPGTQGESQPATFTMSWEDYERYFGATTIGRTS